ncbi:MAG: LptF/LptG family permease [Bacteroidales bacterium]|nr:LptF/LptG family permease [Candidatus Physcousia equi]
MKRIRWQHIKFPKLLNRLDRYLIGKFLGTYFFSIVLIISIAVVFDYNENIDKFTTNHAPWREIVSYYLNFIPYYANLFSSLFIFLSVIFFTTKLASNSEIIAMQAAGVKFVRIMRPYMIGSALIAAITFYLGSEVIPRGSVKRLEFEDQYKRKKKPAYADNIQMQVDTGVIAYIEHYDDNYKTGYHFSLDKFHNKKLVSHLTANSLTYDTLCNEKYHWHINNVTIRDMHTNREIITHHYSLDSVIIMEPRDFISTRYMEQSMTNAELLDQIDKQRIRGNGKVAQFEIEYHKRFANPFAAFIMSIIGLTLSARKRKNGMGRALGTGLALSAGYILFQTISATFSLNAGWPPMLSAWLPNIVFVFIAFYLYKKAPR